MRSCALCGGALVGSQLAEGRPWSGRWLSCPRWGGALVENPQASGPWPGRGALDCLLEILDAALKVVGKLLEVVV